MPKLNPYHHLSIYNGRLSLVNQQRQCDPLSNIRLRKPGSWDNVDVTLTHIPKRCCRPSTPLDDSGLP